MLKIIRIIYRFIFSIYARWERKLAVRNGCYLNIDSATDAVLTAQVAQELDLETNVLVRINPESDMSSEVHDYNQTASKKSKFGVTERHLREVSESKQLLLILDGHKNLYLFDRQGIYVVLSFSFLFLLFILLAFIFYSFPLFILILFLCLLYFTLLYLLSFFFLHFLPLWLNMSRFLKWLTAANICGLLACTATWEARLVTCSLWRITWSFYFNLEKRWVMFRFNFRLFNISFRIFD